LVQPFYKVLNTLSSQPTNFPHRNDHLASSYSASLSHPLSIFVCLMPKEICNRADFSLLRTAAVLSLTEKKTYL